MPGPTEATTRRTLIDPLLRQAGWEVSDPQQVGLEIPVSLLREPGPALGEPPESISDYVLYRANGEIIAIVEAKRTSIDPRLAETQARYYVTEIGKAQGYRPFAFLTNGYDIYFQDMGRGDKRLAQGFFSPEDLEGMLYLREREHLTGLGDLSGVVAGKPSQAFSNFFNGYARAYNKTYQRTGALFQRPFGRIEVTSETYFSTLIAYIHQNPQKHGFVADFREWPWSSYHALLSTKSTHLRRDEVLAWFGGATELEQTHRREIIASQAQALAPDDFD